MSSIIIKSMILLQELTEIAGLIEAEPEERYNGAFLESIRITG